LPSLLDARHAELLPTPAQGRRRSKGENKFQNDATSGKESESIDMTTRPLSYQMAVTGTGKASLKQQRWPNMKMLRVLSLPCIFFLGALAFAQTPDKTAANADLAGLWRAKHVSAGLAHVRLIVSHSDDGYRADMLGMERPLKNESGILTFAVTNGEGQFRGRLVKNGNIEGHWFRGNAAFPVTLAQERSGRWNGTVTTSPDELTFFLLLKPDGKDSWSAVLRNPERDFGSLYGVTKLVRQGGELKLMGRERDKEAMTAKGAYYPERDQVSLVFDRGSFDFTREGDESDFYPRGKKPAPYIYRVPLALEDGWPVSTLASENIDRSAIERLVQKLEEMPMDSLDAPQYEALLIARHGKLVLDEYFHGERRDSLRNIRSAGKSVTSVLVGAVLHDGAPAPRLAGLPGHERWGISARPGAAEKDDDARALAHPVVWILLR